MTLGYKTADGQLVTLSPIPTDRFVNNGEPALRLSGREYAAMTTGRVMRAAQAYFEFPASSAGGGMRAGRAAVAPDEMQRVVDHKKFDVFEDGDSQMLRLVYREIVLRMHADVKPAQRKAMMDRHGLTMRRVNAYNRQQLVVIDDKRRRSGTDLVELAMVLADAPEVAFATPNFVSQFQRSVTAPAALAPPAMQWHLARVRARQAWALSPGKRSITVAVLDDGVDVEHPALRARLHRRPDPDEPRDLCGRDFFLPDPTRTISIRGPSASARRSTRWPATTSTARPALAWRWAAGPGPTGSRRAAACCR